MNIVNSMENYENEGQPNNQTLESDSFLQRLKETDGKAEIGVWAALVTSRLGVAFMGLQNLNEGMQNFSEGQYGQGALRLSAAMAEGIAAWAMGDKARNIAAEALNKNS